MITKYTSPRNKIQFERSYPPSMDFLSLVDSLYEQTRDVAEGNGVSYLIAYHETVPHLFSRNDRTKALEKAILERFELLERFDQIQTLKTLEEVKFTSETRYYLQVFQKDGEVSPLKNMAKLKSMIQVTHLLRMDFEWWDDTSIAESRESERELTEMAIKLGFNLDDLCIFSGNACCSPYLEIGSTDENKVKAFKEAVLEQVQVVQKVRAIQEQLNDQ